MAALIDGLLTTQDTSETVRDWLATLLLVESANQQTLATAAAENPSLWKLRVFVERSNPWELFINDPANATDDACPLVNITLESINFDASQSNIVERQKAVAVYNLDVYGYGQTTETSGGHTAGDSKAAKEAQRGTRLVRQILMSGPYTYLGLTRGTIWRRFVTGIQPFQPQYEDRPVQHVQAQRISLEVQFSEFSPQYSGQVIEEINVIVERIDDEFTLIDATFDVA
jgi:hypothetical protein